MMARLGLRSTALLLSGSLAGLGAADGMSEPLQRLVREATVRIDVHSGVFVSHGSGLVLRRHDHGVLVVTSAEVVPDYSKEVVVWCGVGGAPTRRLDAVLAACDVDHHLTVLQVDGANLPAPLIPLALDAIHETQPAIMAGFTALLLGPREPAWLRPVSVASLRRDEDGRLALIQLDANVQPGMEGGPAVTAAGQLLGMVIGGSGVAGIGFAMPWTYLDDAAGAYPRHCQLEPAAGAGGRLQANVVLYDPLHVVRSVALLAGKPLAGELAKPGTDGQWRVALDHPREIPLTLAGESASGAFALTGAEATGAAWQVRLTLASGGIRLGRPQPFEASAGATAAPGKVTLPALEGGEASQAAMPAVTRQVLSAALLSTPRMLGKVAIQDLAPPAGAVFTAAVWSKDGQAAYLLCPERGTVLRGMMPGFSAVQMLTIGQACSRMALAQGGLLVTVDAPGEVWLLDPASLAVRHRYRVDGSRGLAATPAQPLAFASSGRGVAVIDTTSGRLLGPLGTLGTIGTSRVLVPGGSGELEWELPCLSEDGRLLLVLDGGLLRRFSVAPGIRIEEEGRADRISPDPLQVVLSPDAKQVAVVCRGGNGPCDEADPRSERVSIKVYPVEALGKPAAALPIGASPSCLAMAAGGARYFSHNDSADLVIFDRKGAIAAMLALEEGTPPATTCLALQPGGSKLWVLGGHQGWLVEPPAKP